jgi:hypothetical protein
MGAASVRDADNKYVPTASASAGSVSERSPFVQSQRSAKPPLVGVVTPSVRNRWLQGAQSLSIAQDMIIMQGPYQFVTMCLDSSIKAAAEEAATHKGTAFRYLMTFIMILVLPFGMPTLYVRYGGFFHWNWVKVGSQRIAWSRQHNFLKIFRDNNDFYSREAKIDLGRLRAYLANSTEASVDNVIYLSNQDFQTALNMTWSQFYIGLCTLLMALLIYKLRKWLGQHRRMKKFVFYILHFQWFSEAFPKLKYTNAEICGGIYLYEVVPCVWLAMMLSFIVVIPMCVLFFDESSFQSYFEFDFWRPFCRSIPLCCVAAYVVGKLYLQACSATFTWWLSTPREYAVTERQFEIELDGVYIKLTKHVDYFVVTTEEIELLASMRSIEMWIQVSVLENQPGVNKNGIEDAKHQMEVGNWHEANKKLQELLASLKQSGSDKIKTLRSEAMKFNLITNVYVVDTKSDVSFWLDLCKGSISGTIDEDQAAGVMRETTYS